MPATEVRRALWLLAGGGFVSGLSIRLAEPLLEHVEVGFADGDGVAAASHGRARISVSARRIVGPHVTQSGAAGGRVTVAALPPAQEQPRHDDDQHDLNEQPEERGKARS